jgi:hypothetical protein
MMQECEAEWIAAGLYSEELQEETPGDGKTVKRPIGIRTGLHTGPVFLHYDPVERRLKFTGAHVNRAARIEPIAQPFEAYASEEFAALAHVHAQVGTRGQVPTGSARTIVCEFAGTMQLAKGYRGQYRIYRVLPFRRLELELLAKAIHEFYCETAKANGDTPQSNTALVPWEQLSESLKEANYAQAADIPNKLALLGYELAPLHGMDPYRLVVPVEDMERLAIREHVRWARERERQGWTYGPERDNIRKLHPLLVPWESLNQREQDKDRDTIRNLPRLIAMSGFRLRKIEPNKRA